MPKSHIRFLEPDDLPRIAVLFQKVFRRRRGPPPRALMDHLRNIFLAHPARGPDIGSLVHVREDGAVDGFIGALPQPMALDGLKLRAIVTGVFMVEDPRSSPMAGARLVRRLLSGPQDLTISDTTNSLSFDFQAVLRCHTLPVQSLQWTKVLRPASYAASLLAAHAPKALALPLWPAAGLLDPVLARRLGGRQERRPRRWSDAPLTIGEFVEAYCRFADGFALRPDWERGTLAWLLEQASAKTGLGQPVLRGVFRDSGVLAGAYLAFAKPGGRTVALQIVSGPDAATWVLASLFGQAAALGCASVHGMAQPFLMDALFRNGGVLFRHASGTHVHTARPEVLDAVRANRALIGGLVGEGWTRLVSDDFSDERPAGALAALRGRAARLWPRQKMVGTPAE
jgi:hypothetical protein